MTYSPSQLAESLNKAAETLPEVDFDVASVVAEGHRRRTRQRVVSGLSIAAVVAVAVFAASALSQGVAVTDNVIADNNIAENVELDDPEAPLRVEQTPPSIDDETVENIPIETSPPTPQASELLAPESVLFWADHEDCEQLDDPRHHPQWSGGQSSDQVVDGQPTYGYAFNSGRLGIDFDWHFSSEGPVRSGTCSLSLDLLEAGSETTAVRLFRRYDSSGELLPQEAFYAAWFYIPNDVIIDGSKSGDGSATGFWTIMQLKNMVDLGGEEATSLSAFSVTAGRGSSDSAMHLSVHNKVPCGLAEDCSESANVPARDELVLPAGQWVHLELGWLASSGNDGRLRLWQDGRLVVDYVGPTERINTVRRTWNLASSGRHHLSTPHRLFVDDVVISTEPVSPMLFDS